MGPKEKWRKKNPEKVRDSQKKWRKKNSEKIREYARGWHNKNHHKTLKSSREWKKQNRSLVVLMRAEYVAKQKGYMPCSATPEELEAAFTGRCFICGVSELKCSKRLAMDHDHETGEFRGWLCNNCNAGLGFFKDSEGILIDALHYLMAHQHQK